MHLTVEGETGSRYLSNYHRKYNPPSNTVQVTEVIELSLEGEIEANKTLFDLPFNIMPLF